MKIGIYYNFIPEIDNRERIKLLASTGFEHTAFWLPEPIDNAKAMLPTQARQAGMKVDNIHADFKGASKLWQDTIEWDYVYASYLAYMDLCADNQIPTLIVHVTGSGIFPPLCQLGIDRVNRLLEQAERKNVTIALENLERTEYIDYIFDRVKAEKLGFCYDSGHANCWDKDKTLLKKYGNRLKALHFNDNDGKSDQHLIPGDGLIDWKSIAGQLTALKYENPCTLEVAKSLSDKYQLLSDKEFWSLAHRRAIELFASS